jgi:hypothetical protein
VLIIIQPGSGTTRPVQPDDLGPDGMLKPGLVSRPIAPGDLQLAPTDPVYYGNYVGKYGATGLNAPSEPTTTVSKAITGNKDDNDHLAVVDNLTIPQGYQAYNIVVQGGFTLYEQEDGDERMWVWVGKRKFECKGQGSLGPHAAFLPDPASWTTDEQGSLPIAVETQQARDFAITVDVLCKRTPAALEQWTLDTHATLVNAYAKLWADYQDKLAAQKMKKASMQDLGKNPAQNRIIERTELKKACAALLSGTDIYAAAFNDIAENSSPPLFPRPSIPPRSNPSIVGGDQEAFIRFFEQAFEWEHMMYIFYPYYWARSERWYDSAILDNPDPLFAEFLKAGSARIVVPVRLQLEGDVRYFLMTGQIWGGGAMPGITDTDYLPITEEIKARDDAPGTETPQADPWEVSLPTTLIRLRADDTLPVWQKFTVGGRDMWVPGRIIDGKWVPDYGKLDDLGNWSAP